MASTNSGGSFHCEASMLPTKAWSPPNRRRFAGRGSSRRPVRRPSARLTSTWRDGRGEQAVHRQLPNVVQTRRWWKTKSRRFDVLPAAAPGAQRTCPNPPANASTTARSRTRLCGRLGRSLAICMRSTRLRMVRMAQVRDGFIDAHNPPHQFRWAALFRGAKQAGGEHGPRRETMRARLVRATGAIVPTR